MHEDTIAAIATPTGSGGIGVIRVSGPKARDILQTVFIPHVKKTRPTPYMLRVGHIISPKNELLDEVMAVYMPGPKSFTGEDLIEIYCHAGQAVLGAILDCVLSHDCRPAEPGEFSLRRFVNRGEDLSKLEGAADVVAAKTDLGYRVAREQLLGAYGQQIKKIRSAIVTLLAETEADIDFPEEDSIGTIGRHMLEQRLGNIIEQLEKLSDSYRTGKIIKDGYRVVLLGAPNVGKSSLFNRLIKQTRALVTPIPGTTRDYISEWIDIDGLPVELFDTAGLRKGRGQIEKAGIEASTKLIKQADMLIYVIDITARVKPIPDLKPKKNQRVTIVMNKADRCDNINARYTAWDKKLGNFPDKIITSAKTGRGIKKLLQSIYQQAGIADLTESLVVTSSRHKSKIDKCLRHLRQVKKEINLPPDIISLELRRASDTIGEITGNIYTEQILDEIFSRFCVGK